MRCLFPGHAYVRKWILLTEPDDSSNTPKGYLKATMCILGAGDEPPVSDKMCVPGGVTVPQCGMSYFHATDASIKNDFCYYWTAVAMTRSIFQREEKYNMWI